MSDSSKETVSPSLDFVREMITADVAAGKHGGRVATRFPPEPNGYLHIGHAKSICLNFGVARAFAGTCNLRFDDTNPETEDPEYVASIQRDVRWLGFEWDALLHTSDYFEQLYGFAVGLIEKGRAYVDSQTLEAIREGRGTVGHPGTPSPYRDRPVADSLDLFAWMRAGEFPDGAHVLRAKIDMTSANMLMRDPILYRIRHAEHYRAGAEWHVFPMYDFAHCLSDAIEGITHSLCTLEFENNRELYDWLVGEVGFDDPPEQTEFARLNLSYTMMSKRKLLQLVREGHVRGWDDPRMPTLSAFRRRGYTPEAIRAFSDRVGVAKTFNIIDLALLEFSIRDDLNHRAPRVLCVLDPLKVVIENFAADDTETIDAPYWPHDVPKEGSRPLPFGREIYIERDDFDEDPPPKYHRLAPGREVRLRYGYVIRCTGVDKNDAGEVVAVRCTYDPTTRGGRAAGGRKVAGAIHWVAVAEAVPVEVRLYDRLFTAEAPGTATGDPIDDLNPNALVVRDKALIEPSVVADGTPGPGTHFQFERQGYFVVDPDSSDDRPVFNLTVTLRDSWAKASGSDDERAVMAAAKAAAKAAHKAQQRALQTAVEPERVLTTEQTTRAEGYVARCGLMMQDAALLARDDALGSFFEAAVEAHDQASTVAKWIVNELLGAVKDRSLDDLPFDGAGFGQLVALVDGGTITGAAGKEVLSAMIAGEGNAETIVAERGLEQIGDVAALAPLVDQVLADNQGQVGAYRAGKTALMGFFVGQIMRASKGKADPKQVQTLLREKLG